MMVLLFAYGCAPSGSTVHECYSATQFSRMVSPVFSSYTMRTVADGKHRIDIYLQMPYSALRFVKKNGMFHAVYSYMIVVRNEDDMIVQSKETERSINVPSFEESVSSRIDVHLERILLDSGTYAMEIIAQDERSKLRYRTVERFIARPIDPASLSVSTFLMLNTVTYEGSAVSLQPIFPEHVSILRDTLGVFQEIYNVRSGDTVSVSHAYDGPDTADASNPNFIYGMPPYRVEYPWCSSDNSRRYYRHDSVFIAGGDDIVRLIQSYPVPAVGSTTINRTIRLSNGLRRDSATASVSIFRRDPQYRTSLTADEILQTMRYILREKEYDTLSAPTEEEQFRKIELYWKKQGGRQRKNEFERRIRDANTMFTSCVDGSRTPMGIVYIVCGTPEYIDCRGSYEENWYYAIGERTFVVQFRPANGTAKIPYYELAPFSVNESFWQYHIDRWRRRQ